MAWVAVAVGVGSAVVSYSASKDAAGAARDSSNAMAQASADQLEFQQQQYADWQGVYGPIQAKLANFYDNLTAEQLTTSGLQQFEQQHTAAQDNIRRSFAQRGIDSPAMALLDQQASLSSATGKAKIRADAPLTLATAQQGFVNGSVMNPAGQGVSNAMNNITNMHQSNMTANNQMAISGAQAAGTALNGAVDAYVTSQYRTTPAGQPATKES